MKTKLHAIFGVVGFLCILTFSMSTVFSELFSSDETIASIKQMIFIGMFVLLPALVAAGGTGVALLGKRTDAEEINRIEVDSWQSDELCLRLLKYKISHRKNKIAFKFTK
ncbi:MAG: hypothetical protein GY786_16275 [Proteobacteria bacterium]|nr:hypothetical protein [Pseudomonadota bacterium]